MFNVSAILIAAGESTRMGKSKALLSWRRETLLSYQIKCLIEAGVSKVVVVLGHNADQLKPYVTKADNVLCIVNEQYSLGKATSIKAGLKGIDNETEAILILAVDQPRTSAIISKVISSHRRMHALITSPRYDGHGGHPLIFSVKLRRNLEEITEEHQGVREIFQLYFGQINQVEIDDPMISLDMNTVEVYNGAKEFYNA